MRNEINKNFDVRSARKFKNKYLRRRVPWEVCVELSFTWKIAKFSLINLLRKRPDKRNENISLPIYAVPASVANFTTS